MKAIKVTVDLREWSKIGDFLRDVMNENIFAYQVDSTSFLVVTENEYGMAFLRSLLEVWFEEELIINDLNRSMEERIIVARGNVSRIARMKNCSREMVSHSLAFRKNTRLARSIRKLALELGGIKVGGTDKEETGNER